MNRLHTTLPTVAKKYAWNLKYGLLGYPHFAAREDIVRYLSARLPELSSALDLGCGRGSLQREWGGLFREGYSALRVRRGMALNRREVS